MNNLRLPEPHLFDAQTKGFAGLATIHTIPAHPDGPRRAGAFVAEPKEHVSTALKPSSSD